MRRRLALPVIALVGAATVWLVLRPRPGVAPVEELPPTADGPATGPSPIASAMSTDLAGTPQTPRPTRVERGPGVTEVRYGALTVALEPPAGTTTPKGFSFAAEPIGFEDPAPALPVEQEDGRWRYDRLPSGRWRVRAFVPGFADAAREVDVKPNGEATLSIPLEIGGAASWKVALLSGESPELVRVALLDGRGYQIEGTYQTGATTLHAAPASVPALPAEGRVLGLRVGRYRLRASTVDGVPSEKPFEVKAGETVELEFTLAR